MTRPRRIVYPTHYRIGSLQLVTLRRRRGYAIATLDGRIVFTEAHPISGRPIPALRQDVREALRIADAIEPRREHREMTDYVATMDTGAEADFATIREARRWAESFGDAADLCTVRTASGRVVAEHRRDSNGDGRRWFRAAMPKPRWEDIANAGRNPHPIPDFPPRRR